MTPINEESAGPTREVKNRRTLKKLLTAFPFCTINSAGKSSEEDDSIKVLDMVELICKSI
jgi:hypothetical protein